MRTITVRSLFTLALLAATSQARAQYEPPNSLPWPLYRQDAPSIPREALGNAFGEYQNFGERYVHTGIDIRGAEGDVVKVVAPGNIWVTVSYFDDACWSANLCRIYVKGSRYVYYYSHLQLHEESDITAETREKIINASRWSAGTGTYPVQPNTSIDAGTVLSRIGPFGSDWPHLHFAIVDPTQNYDAINPLTALARSAGGIDIIDDERPVISALELFRDGMQSPLPVPDSCTPISGAVDIAATMQDSFYTNDPAPYPVHGGWLSSFGVYEAEYRIRNIASGTTLHGTWYRFDRAPLRCAGPLRGSSCPIPATEATFAEHSFLASNGSAGLTVGAAYTPFLFATDLSTSDYLGVERHVHLLTNEWGQEGSWNTASYPDGWYQVTAIARDADGNQQALSRHVAVDNHGDFVPPADVYVRDNDVDVGALPSTLGGHPFWTSPDIFILPAGSPRPAVDAVAPGTRLSAGATYDVYVRVHNDSCREVTGIRTQVYSANPAMIVDESQWTYVTPSGEFLPPVGLTLPPGTKDFLGPFPWTPTEAEATSNDGHRCMLAKVDAANDPLTNAPVPENNNVAQRNLQFEGASFAFNNPDGKSAKIETEMRCNGFPFAAKGSVLELRVEYDSALEKAWSGAPGTKVSVSGKELVVGFTRCNVRLPSVSLPAFTNRGATFRSVVGEGGKGPYTIDLPQYADGKLRGGMSFVAKK